MDKTTIFLTGATGVMGGETLKLLLDKLDIFNIRLLVRPSDKNRKKLLKIAKDSSIEVIWGDLTNYDDVKKALGNAELVLHIGGMVSPMADHQPELTMKVNVGAAENIVRAIKERPDADDVRLVYIGSVAQTAHHMEPHHWGRTGDPIITGIYDVYGISKIKAERIIAESGLQRWVSLRQSGILHKDLIYRGSDPITFHVPLRGVLEWSTVEDSARLMLSICQACRPGQEVDETFWRSFYNIGSGSAFRLSNYEFEVLLLKALGCPPPEKIFDADWFATRNFHGHWYTDSDKLEELFHFRESITAEEYFKRMRNKMPCYMRLTPLVPAWVIKMGMKMVARTRGNGTLDWFARGDCEHKIKAYFGSREAHAGQPDWEHQDLSRPSDIPVLIDHGYDETKPESDLMLADMQGAARFRGGKCLSETMTNGDLETPLEWQCAFGHKFEASPRLILKGGHWCPDCMPAPWRYDSEAKVNPFLAQLWYDSFSPTEEEVYQ